MSTIKYPEVLVCGFPRSGTSLVTELAYILSGYPKPLDFIGRNNHKGVKYAGYNEFHEMFVLFHYIVEKLFPEDMFLHHRFNDNVMWEELSNAIANFLQKKKCFVFKENHLLRTIAGFREHFAHSKVIYVDRDPGDVYRSVCQAWNIDSIEYPYKEFLKDYSKSINMFTNSWAWKIALKIDYNMLVNEKTAVIKMIADYVGVPLRQDRFDLCVTFINPKKND